MVITRVNPMSQSPTSEEFIIKKRYPLNPIEILAQVDEHWLIKGKIITILLKATQTVERYALN
jgi:hypothetical protein